MIIPMNSGRGITPIYIPSPVVTHAHEEQPSSGSYQGSEPGVGAWVLLVVVIILLIGIMVYVIELIKHLGDEK